MTYQKISCWYLWLQELVYLGLAILCTFIFLFWSTRYPAVTYIVLTAMWLVYACCAFIFLPLRYKYTAYRLDDDCLYYRSGWLLHREQIMARDRIIFITQTKNPFTPILHIASLTIRAPGATIRIRCLSVKQAEALTLLLSPKALQE